MTEPFVPLARPPKPKPRNVNIQLSQDEYERVVAAAEKAGVSTKSLTKQALFYALEHMSDA